MQQQINLYRYLPHPIKSFLDLKMLTLLLGGFFGFLMVIFLIGFIHTEYLSSRLAKINLQLTQSRQHFQDLAAQFPEIDSAEHALLNNEVSACSTKFSPYFEAFANAIVSGVWLTEINISNNGRHVSLIGYASRAIGAEEFLEQLNKQPVFANLPFVIQNLSAVNNTTPKQPMPNNTLSFNLLAGKPE